MNERIEAALAEGGELVHAFTGTYDYASFTATGLCFVIRKAVDLYWLMVICKGKLVYEKEYDTFAALVDHEPVDPTEFQIVRG